MNQDLWIYFLLVAGIVSLPGLDMAFVMGSSLTGGRRAGLPAVAGVVAGVSGTPYDDLRMVSPKPAAGCG
ncbi:MAG TPA: hypothetical protein VFE90_24280 [Myxococcales bacterium]|nr:hypothetical protein [Myxococcales bacterium]